MSRGYMAKHSCGDASLTPSAGRVPSPCCTSPNSHRQEVSSSSRVALRVGVCESAGLLRAPSAHRAGVKGSVFVLQGCWDPGPPAGGPKAMEAALSLLWGLRSLPCDWGVAAVHPSVPDTGVCLSPSWVF